MTRFISQLSRLVRFACFCQHYVILFAMFILLLFGPNATAQPSWQSGKASGWYSQVDAAIRQSEYHVTWHEKARELNGEACYQAPNRAQNLRTFFSATGVKVVPRVCNNQYGLEQWQLGLRVDHLARGNEVEHTHQASICTDLNRLEYDYGTFNEWYVNDANGLEQGYTFHERPVIRGLADRGSPLRVAIKVTGSLFPQLTADQSTVDFVAVDGRPIVRLSYLHAHDSHGKRVDVRFSLEQEFLNIDIDDRDACFPLIVDPLLTSTAWTVEVNQASAKFGTSVATAGDVNGDGYSDVIVGAPLYDNGDSDEGRVHVYHGSSTGLSTSPSWTAESNQAGAEFGTSVATAGSVNGDSYSDIIIGAPKYDNGETNEGAAFVWLGSGSGLGSDGTPGNADWMADGNTASGLFGYSVATAGDVNGDGYSDVIVGEPDFVEGDYPEMGEIGKAHVYYGENGGLPSSASWYTTVDQDTDGHIGKSVATAGDVDGDGYSDVIIGAPGVSHIQDGGLPPGSRITEIGAGFLYKGSSTGLPMSKGQPAPDRREYLPGPGNYAHIGESVGTAGDVDGDGLSDIVMGSDHQFGFAQLYLSSSMDTCENPPCVFYYEPDWYVYGGYLDYYGISVSTAGDVNGDGYADIIAGARDYSNGESGEGRVLVYYGRPGGPSTTASWITEGGQANAHFAVVSCAGDVNGDGYSDVIIGAPNYSNGQSEEGTARLFYGSAGGLATSTGWTAESDQSSSKHGTSVASAGDVNADGFSDVIVGAPFFDNGQTDEGAVFVYHGSSSGPSTSPNWSAESNQANAHLGAAVSSAGDVNGDGYGDVIVGIPDYDNGQTNEGRASIWLGDSSGLETSASWTVESNQAQAHLGSCVSAAGDVNGDGYGDVLVGLPDYDDPMGLAQDTDHGAVRVYVGGGSGPSATATKAWVGPPSSHFGKSVAAAGDVNGDGYSDVIIGAPDYSNGESSEGRAYMFAGASSLSSSPTWTVESNQASSNFGFCLSSAGDINGDGYSDIVVGAPFYDNGQTDEGAAFVFHGSGSGLSTSADSAFEGGQVNAHLGVTVATAGDANGDGYCDIVIGAPEFDNGQTDEGIAIAFYGSSTGLPNAYDWISEGDQGSASFGASVASAGDVNGDGYADLIIGSPNYDNGSSEEGRAFIYYGNQGDGIHCVPKQFKTGLTTFISPLGLSDSTSAFRFSVLCRTPFGPGKVKLYYEAKQLGTSFNGTGTASSTWTNTESSGATVTETVSGLTTNSLYHWRVRIIYNPVTTPFQPAGRWLSIPLNGWNEADLRTIP